MGRYTGTGDFFDLNNHANQLNPNNWRFWRVRGGNHSSGGGGSGSGCCRSFFCFLLFAVIVLGFGYLYLSTYHPDELTKYCDAVRDWFKSAYETVANWFKSLS